MKKVALVQIGYGTVGGAAIRQVVAQRPAWHEMLGLDVRIAAVAGSNGTVLHEGDTELTDEQLTSITQKRGAEGLNTSLTEIVPTIKNADVVILMDAAAGESTTDALVGALNAGGGAVLSNKAPMALPHSDSRTSVLWEHAGIGGRLRYEATCGAGLPVISTLQSLMAQCDEMIEIVGALSGTFGAIFSSVADGTSFSTSVSRAKANGYTEPDPRDDLSGLDVARKALILARTMGREIDLDEITVQSLVPDSLTDVSINDFLSGLRILNDDIGPQSMRARMDHAALKYVAVVKPEGAISVGLQAVPTSTVLGALQGPENVVSFRTKRYDEYPTVVSGPGAGADVTAAGMIGDALALAKDMN